MFACAAIAALGLGAGRARPAFAAARAHSVPASLTTTDGRTRTYHVYVPRSLPRHRPVPLLVALHGGFGSGTQFEANSGFDALADLHHFIVVYPDGTPIRSRGALANARVWNGGRCCGPAARQQVDDVGFIRQLIDEIRRTHAIDPARIFATGHSNGGILAYRLACEAADVVVAIGVQSSSLELDHCQPSRPVSTIHIHGTADRNVPITGGRGPNGVSGVSFRVPIDGARTLAAANGCASTPSQKHDPANSDVTITRWTSCDGGTEVRFVTVKGASHAWMGHPTAAPRTVGPAYENLDSSAVIWQFLSTHPRR